MKKFLLFITAMFIIIPLFSIEIPTLDITILRVGVVDMDKILQEHPITEKVQQEISLLKHNRDAEIASIEKELEDLIKQKLTIVTEIEQLESQLNQLSVSTPTTETITTSDTEKPVSSIQTTEPVSQQIEQIKSNIETKKKNLEQIDQTITDKKQQVKQKRDELNVEIEKIKQKTEMQLYAELYQIIQQIAQQENLNIIIDKSGILYGESNIDITEKVLKKLKQ